MSWLQLISDFVSGQMKVWHHLQRHVSAAAISCRSPTHTAPLPCTLQHGLAWHSNMLDELTRLNMIGVRMNVLACHSRGTRRQQDSHLDGTGKRSSAAAFTVKTAQPN